MCRMIKLRRYHLVLVNAFCVQALSQQSCVGVCVYAPGANTDTRIRSQPYNNILLRIRIYGVLFFFFLRYDIVFIIFRIIHHEASL